MEEIWKSIPGYEGIYSASNLGRIKRFYSKKEKILKPFDDSRGYLQVSLTKNKISKTIKVHQLIAMAFLGHIPNRHTIVVNHIDYNKLNNSASNLELITTRENTNKKNKKHSSIYTGVCWDKLAKSWTTSITINCKPYFLGRFKEEYNAHLAYEKALAELLLKETI